ncbi:MAG: hypothetical protein IT385_25635 [Deltaproteobacteria bacterium]|nr:hypothetical protein [Deltaproteobacteria bacterium]
MDKPRLFQGRWRDEVGRLTFEITADDPPRVSAWEEALPPRTARVQRLDGEPGRWVPARDPTSEAPRYRLDTIEVELGSKGLGTTLQMMFAVENDGTREPRDKLWVTVPDGADPDVVRLHLEQGASYYEAVLGAWDDAVEAMNEAEGGWIRPYGVLSRVAPDRA